MRGSVTIAGGLDLPHPRTRFLYLTVEVTDVDGIILTVTEAPRESKEAIEALRSSGAAASTAGSV